MKVRTKLLFVSSAALLSMTGCVDQDKSLFDPEATAAIYEESFPVKNIDPDQDWTTTTSVSASIAVEEDAGVSYTVRVFTDNPLAEDTDAKLLATGVASKGQPFVFSVDVPNSLDGVYVTRTDSHNRHLMKFVSVENGTLNVTFGSTQVKTRGAATRSESDEIPTYEPEKSAADINALLADAETLTDESYGDGGSTYSIKAGKVYKIPAGATVSKINTLWLENSGRATVIVAGTCKSTVAVQDNVDIYVINGGKYEIPDGEKLSLIGTSRMTVYPGGELTGNEFEYTNGYGKTYWGGKVTLNTLSYNGGDIYNYGNMNIGYLKSTNKYWVSGTQSGGCRFINQGSAVVTEFHQNGRFYNNCSLTATTFRGSLITGANTKTTVSVLSDTNGDGGEYILGDNSMVEATVSANLGAKSVTGPSNDAHALLRLKELTGINDFNTTGNVYYEVDKVSESLAGDVAEYNWGWGYLRYSYLKLSQDGATVAKSGESPFILPAGDCSSTGNAPVDEGTTDFDLIPQLSYTYAFEDNYPGAGDYDFNDLVLDVTVDHNQNATTGAVESIDLNITLKAVGGIKTLGAGLRLYGIDKSKIESVSFDGDVDVRNTLADSQFDNANLEEGDTYAVIPLFGNAHAALGVSNIITNTRRSGSYATADTKTLKVTIKTTEQLSVKDNLDFFITNGSLNNKKRVEIHQYNFLVDNGNIKSDAATAKGSVCPDNLDIISQHNYTWAVCVPDFKYPYETVSIADAYPKFSSWAENHTADEDWYEYPSSSKDKIY